MSNTDLPMISSSKSSRVSGHWPLLIGAILTLTAIIGLTATPRPPVDHAPRGELAAAPSAAP